MIDIAVTILMLFESTSVTQDPTEYQTVETPLPVLALEFSPDGQYLAAATGSEIAGGGGVVVWETSGWNPHIVRYERNSCSDVSFSPDGKTLAFSVYSPDAGLIDVSSGRLLKRFAVEPARTRSVDISPDGKMLATSGDDRNVKLWNLDTLELMKILKGHEDIVHDACFSMDGTRILSASKDTTARLWNAKAGELIESFQTGDHTVRRVEFSVDGRFFLTSRYDGRTRIYDAETLQLRAMFSAGAYSARISHDGRFVATSQNTTNNPALVFHLNLDDPTIEQQKKIDKLIEDFSDDDFDERESASDAIVEFGLLAERALRKAMESSSAEVRLRARRARSRILSPVPDVTLSGHPGPVAVVCFSPDDRLLVTGCGGGSIRVWEVGSWKLLRELSNPLYQPKDSK